VTASESSTPSIDSEKEHEMRSPVHGRLPKVNTKHSEASAQRQSRALAAQPRLAELEQRLLELGGEEVVFLPEPHLELILERGREFNEQPVQVRGEPNRCHENSANFWELNRSDTGIGRGWALSDNLWIQHSWLLRDNVLIETTEDRTAYFGVALTDDEAETFVELARSSGSHDACVHECMSPPGPANLLTRDQMCRMAFEARQLLRLLAEKAGWDNVADFFASLQQFLTFVELGLKPGGRGRKVDKAAEVFSVGLLDMMPITDLEEAINLCGFLWDRAPGGPGRFSGALRTALAGHPLWQVADFGDSIEEVAAVTVTSVIGGLRQSSCGVRGPSHSDHRSDGAGFISAVVECPGAHRVGPDRDRDAT
jgi:hypothetical protein